MRVSEDRCGHCFDDRILGLTSSRALERRGPGEGAKRSAASSGPGVLERRVERSCYERVVYLEPI